MIAALVPAGGQSRRMGRPKLLLPIGGVTLIARVVSELRKGGADIVVVVAPAREIEGASEVAAEATRQGAHVITPPEPTADMRASIELGLDWLERGPAPSSLVLAPADSPGLAGEVVARILAKAKAFPAAILVPAFQGQRGHPILLPWTVALEIKRLPAGSGVNALLARRNAEVIEIELGVASVVEDLDTPDDYEKYNRREEDQRCRTKQDT
jgi:molybdenum cofactor cytidylyltransferase